MCINETQKKISNKIQRGKKTLKDRYDYRWPKVYCHYFKRNIYLITDIPVYIIYPFQIKNRTKSELTKKNEGYKIRYFHY